VFRKFYVNYAFVQAQIINTSHNFKLPAGYDRKNYS